MFLNTSVQEQHLNTPRKKYFEFKMMYFDYSLYFMFDQKLNSIFKKLLPYPPKIGKYSVFSCVFK